MKPPYTMEFTLPDRTQLRNLKAGQHIIGSVQKQGRDYVLTKLKAAAPSAGIPALDVPKAKGHPTACRTNG